MRNLLKIYRGLKPAQCASLVLVLIVLATSFTVFVPRKAEAQVHGLTLSQCSDWTKWTSTYFQSGDSGGCVWAIEHFLNQWLWINGLSQINSSDGKFDTATRNAVNGFQWLNGLQIDGLAGPKTLEKMNNVCHSWTEYPFYHASPACITL